MCIGRAYSWVANRGAEGVRKDGEVDGWRRRGDVEKEDTGRRPRCTNGGRKEKALEGGTEMMRTKCQRSGSQPKDHIYTDAGGWVRGEVAVAGDDGVGGMDRWTIA